MDRGSVLLEGSQQGVKFLANITAELEKQKWVYCIEILSYWINSVCSVQGHDRHQLWLMGLGISIFWMHYIVKILWFVMHMETCWANKCIVVHAFLHIAHKITGVLQYSAIFCLAVTLQTGNVLTFWLWIPIDEIATKECKRRQWSVQSSGDFIGRYRATLVFYTRVKPQAAFAEAFVGG